MRAKKSPPTKQWMGFSVIRYSRICYDNNTIKQYIFGRLTVNGYQQKKQTFY